MTAPQRDDDGRSGPERSEFHGPAAVQDGNHNVQNNHFHAPGKRTAAFPWGAVVTSVKNGLVTLIVVGALGGGAWWAYDHVQKKDQRINAKRAGCDQALRAFYQGGIPVSLLHPHDVSVTRYVEQLEEAARTVGEPKIARSIRYTIQDVEAARQAYDRGDENALSEAQRKAHRDREEWWAPCWEAAGWGSVRNMAPVHGGVVDE
ncbi:hypothetical protein ABTX60_41000 [Streptomyces sp. NPDC126510]|uniref:hypothetical protein n=1 Tax=Streptomyces sp. NPDC126510 TaxID=3155317 RepID=UPI003334698C